MPHGITQCYLPPGRGDIPALTPAKAGTRLSDPREMQGWVDLDNTDITPQGPHRYFSISCTRWNNVQFDTQLTNSSVCSAYAVKAEWSVQKKIRSCDNWPVKVNCTKMPPEMYLVTLVMTLCVIWIWLAVELKVMRTKKVCYGTPCGGGGREQGAHCPSWGFQQSRDCKLVLCRAVWHAWGLVVCLSALSRTCFVRLLANRHTTFKGNNTISVFPVFAR